MKIIGIQDYSMPVTKWLDLKCSVSWLRTFEMMAKDHQCHALLREHHYNSSIQEPIRGVNYTFSQTTDLESIKKISNKIDPDIIFYNFCEYKKLSDILPKMQVFYPWCLHIVRVHHEAKRVLQDKKILLNIINNSDIIILGNGCDLEFIKSVNPDTKCHVIPFGIDTTQIVEKINKKIDIVSSSGDNPVKRIGVLNDIFDNLNIKGYSTKNLIGINKQEYLSQLQSGRYFLMTSVSEASGSRSLLEAINFGLYPVVTKECESAMLICKEFDKNYNNFISVKDSTEESVEKIIKIIKLNPYFPNKENIINYDENLESIKLKSLFENSLFNFKNIDELISKNFIRKFLYDVVKLSGINIKKISDIQSNLKNALKNKKVFDQFDKIWCENGFPLDNLPGFKEKMTRTDFDIYENLGWIFF